MNDQFLTKQVARIIVILLFCGTSSKGPCFVAGLRFEIADDDAGQQGRMDLQTITFSKKPSVTTRRAAAATSTSASVKKAPAPKADKPSSPIKKIAKKRPVRSAGLMKNENDAPQEVLPEITSPFNVTKHASENPFAVLAEMNEREEAGSVLAEQAQPMAELAQPMAEKAATKKPSFFGMFINFFAKKTVTKSA
eukprot:jgi/Chrpa1/3520/Chrysochromulina_OHIO_Genome00006917-RA